MIEENNCTVLFVVFHHAVSSDPCFTSLISQNHRKVEIGRDCWRSSSPIPLLKLGHLQQVVQTHVQSAFGYLPEWRLHNLSVQMDSNLTARWPSISCNHDNPFVTMTPIKSGCVTEKISSQISNFLILQSCVCCTELEIENYGEGRIVWNPEIMGNPQ